MEKAFNNGGGDDTGCNFRKILIFGTEMLCFITPKKPLDILSICNRLSYQLLFVFLPGNQSKLTQLDLVEASIWMILAYCKGQDYVKMCRSLKLLILPEFVSEDSV